ncbi:MAG: Uma2 family endonuclease [Acidobacteriia bacterium]|nr:Uma2 family endonuclease [Terriglobia bacterium]
MGATTKLNFEEFWRLRDAAQDSARYELDEGELLLTPSPAPRHNIVRYRLRRALTDFVQAYHLGLVLDETDFRLSENTVRKPDLAFIARERMKGFDPDRSPIECAPSLAVEVISPTNLAQDTLKKVHQYMAAGCQSVWLAYPALRLIEIHDAAGVREIAEPQSLIEERLFPGLKFSLLLTALFDDNPER